MVSQPKLNQSQSRTSSLALRLDCRAPVSGLIVADLDDVRALSWGAPELPEDFQPLEAMVLIKGVYVTDDGSLTRPTWCFRWTEALAENQAERIGALQIAHRLAIDEAAENYDPAGE